jgi:hypothetical protein
MANHNPLLSYVIYITRVLARALFVHTRATTESEYGKSQSFAQLDNVAPCPL